ncbi:hypothetical protein C8Q79DRAFT_292569 [Trametes meyenii]|nr:hypothetical protein C8Q79DRAFT_292569 [Trametes meyenii]
MTHNRSQSAVFPENRPLNRPGPRPVADEKNRNATWGSLLSSATKVAGLGILQESEPRAGWRKSCWMVLTASWLNLLLLIIPVAWVSHWQAEQWGHEVTFILCFICIIPLQNIFDWCGEQVARRTGHDLGDFIAITFKNCVEVTLAAILLRNCHLRLLQSTIIGVVILHLLLVPGTAFFVQGSQTFQQILHPHHASLNPSLLMTGVLAIMLPTAFFAALDRGNDTVAASASEHEPFSPLVSDVVRDDLLRMSRGISVMLLLIYVSSRVYRHISWPPRFPWTKTQPGTASADEMSATDSHIHQHRDDEEFEDGELDNLNEPLLHPVVYTALIMVSIAVMAVTAEFLVESIDPIRERNGIQAEWFGLILLPLVSFSPEAAIAAWCFGRTLYTSLGGHASTPTPPASLLAHGRPIDMSIQFTLWWMPLLVLFAWWTEKPLHLLFDYFEVSLLLGSCFLVNYVTADGKTNFAEGVVLVTFYVMIATASWFYPGQPQVSYMLNCPGSVAAGVANGVENALVTS